MEVNPALERLVSNYNEWKDVRNKKLLQKCKCHEIQPFGQCVCVLKCILCGSPESDCQLHLCESHRRYSAAIRWSLDNCLDLSIGSNCVGSYEEEGDLWYISKGDALHWTRSLAMPKGYGNGYFFTSDEKHLYPLTLKVETNGIVSVKVYCNKVHSSTFEKSLSEKFIPVTSLKLTIFGIESPREIYNVSLFDLTTYAKFMQKKMHPASFHILPRFVKKVIGEFVCGNMAYFLEPYFPFDIEMSNSWTHNRMPKRFGQLAVATYHSGEYPKCNLSQLVE